MQYPGTCGYSINHVEMELMEKHNIVKKKLLVDKPAEPDLPYQRFMELQHFPPTKQSIQTLENRGELQIPRPYKLLVAARYSDRNTKSVRFKTTIVTDGWIKFSVKLACFEVSTKEL